MFPNVMFRCSDDSAVVDVAADDDGIAPAPLLLLLLVFFKMPLIGGEPEPLPLL